MLNSEIIAQILSAIGVNLRNKASIYADASLGMVDCTEAQSLLLLGALFLVNNLSYINKLLKDPSLQHIISDQRLNAYYDSEIEEHLRRYLARCREFHC